MWCQKRSGPGCADAYADEADVANIYDGEVPKSDDKYTRGGDAFGRGLGTTMTTCARGMEFAEENAKKMIMSDVRRHPTMMSLRGLFPVSQS